MTSLGLAAVAFCVALAIGLRLAARRVSFPVGLVDGGVLVIVSLLLADLLRFHDAEPVLALIPSEIGVAGALLATAAIFGRWVEYICETWLMAGCLTIIGVFVTMFFWRLPTTQAGDVNIILISLVLFMAITTQRSMRVFFGSGASYVAMTAFVWLRLAAWSLATAHAMHLPFGSMPLGRVLIAVAYGCAAVCVGLELSAQEVRGRQPRPDSVASGAFVLIGLVTAVEIVAFFVLPQMNRWSVLVLTAGSAAALLCRQVLTNARLTETTRAAQERERYYRSLVQDSTDVIAICDRAGRLDYVSPSAGAVIGRVQLPLPVRSPATDLIGCTAQELDDAFATVEATGVSRLESRRGDQILETSVSRREGQYVLSVRDVTERARLRARLHELAYTDSLTGLANRHRLLLDIAALQQGAGAEPVHALFVDLDRFKHVNDASGHGVGDAVLRQVAARLREHVPHGALLARLGGDEFVVVLTGRAADAERVASSLHRAMARPFRVDEQVYQLGASIGIASSAPGVDADELLQRADLAMYQAKQVQQPWRRYEPGMTAQVRRQAALDHQLAQEWGSDAVGVHLQPIVSTADLSVHSTEALLRWRHPDGRVSGPMGPIGFAQRTGRLTTLTGWIVEKVLAEVVAHPTVTTPIAVNMPPSVLAERDFVAGLASRISLLGIPPTRITLEITEDAVVEQGTAGLRALRALHDEGFRLHIDDFGTGFSSLSYLLRLPVDGLKIDRSFTMELEASAAARSVVLGLVSLSRELGIELIAEGVETPAEHEILQALGVPYAQGYWYARPQDMGTVTDRSSLRGWAAGGSAALDLLRPAQGVALPSSASRASGIIEP